MDGLGGGVGRVEYLRGSGKGFHTVGQAGSRVGCLEQHP